MPELEPGRREPLGKGYAITAPNLRGTVERLEPGATGTRARENLTPTFDAALARNEMTSASTIEIKAAPVPGEGTGTELRTASGDSAILLETPDLGPTRGQVVAVVDEAGSVSWVFPEGTADAASTDRGSGTKRFLIRKFQPPAPETGTGERSLFGAIGKKLLKVIVYPITDGLIGLAASKIAEHWEGNNRKYGLRDFTPSNFTSAEGKPLTGGDVETLSRDRALLFIHGTFSTAHGAFQEIPPELMKTLYERYGNRVFAFNHFTLSHDPRRNTEWLAAELRKLADKQLEVDIVCHSRGGIVARTIADGHGTFSQDRVRVRRIAFVATPNNGTLLAEPDHVVNMIDRLTSGLNLLPPGGFADFLDGLLIAVKVIGHGALKGLDGIQSMNAKGPFMKELNTRGQANADYYAVAANYDPQDPGLKGLVKTVGNAAIDRVFNKAENDLVVPELGVYDANGSASFPIKAANLLRLPATEARWHTQLFGHPKVAEKLNEWLA